MKTRFLHFIGFPCVPRPTLDRGTQGRTATALCLLILMIASLNAWSAPNLQGTWQYYAYRYRGVVEPPVDSSLIMRFQFNSNDTDDLSWTDDSGTSCNRQATYSVNNGKINEYVTWVDPQNTADCGSDPNMQPDVQSQFVYRLVNGHLEIDADLGDEIITYLWKTVQVTSKNTEIPSSRVAENAPVFSDIVNSILQPNCIACHGPTSQYPVTDYDFLIKNSWVVPGNPQASELYKTISFKRMPPKNPLDAADIGTIETWITNGAPNN